MGHKDGFGNSILFLLVMLLSIFWACIVSFALDPEHCAEIFLGICFVVPSVIGLGYLAVQNHRDTEEARNQRKKNTPTGKEIL